MAATYVVLVIARNPPSSFVPPTFGWRQLPALVLASWGIAAVGASLVLTGRQTLLMRLIIGGVGSFIAFVIVTKFAVEPPMRHKIHLAAVAMVGAACLLGTAWTYIAGSPPRADLRGHGVGGRRRVDGAGRWRLVVLPANGRHVRRTRAWRWACWRWSSPPWRRRRWPCRGIAIASGDCPAQVRRRPTVPFALVISTKSADSCTANQLSSSSYSPRPYVPQFAATAANIADFIDYSLYSSRGPVILPGRLFVPPEATTDPLTPRPLMLFLHGGGAIGTNNITQVEHTPDYLLDEAKRRGAFLYVPQAPSGLGGSPRRSTPS